MTSRLKHKLELDNVNLKSAYLNESFVQIGTPLPALAETRKDKLEYVPVWQQEARDEKGRRRFHGAFTGGFSAGYFNTVGSKEGWAPSSFKSSRSNRTTTTQRPEDFMDEEDLQAMNDDRRLENTDTFKGGDGFRGTQDELAERGLPGALESMIAPSRSSIGQKLLQKLGWRPGQGIGPRVSLRRRRIQEGKPGRTRTDANEDEEMDEETVRGKTFAPRDVKLVVYDSKDDRQGLGFVKGRGMARMPGRAGPAFGAGHVDDDDDDPYTDAGPSHHHLAFELGDDNDDVINIGGPSQPPVPKSANRAGNNNDSSTWHDGRPILPGFELDPKGVPPDKWFEMPEIPPDWRPRPARVWGTTRKWDEEPGAQKEVKEVIRGAPGRPLTFEQRGAALGEEQHISKAKSVYEYMSEKDKERLASLQAAEKEAPPPPLVLEVEDEEAPRERPTTVEVPPLSPRTASAALRGFIPYSDDLPKQDRYRSYLVSQTYNSPEPNPKMKPNASVDEMNKELEDFAGSARIFKPLSFAMSSRFTSGSASLAASDMKQAKAGLHLYDAEKAKAEAEAAEARKKEEAVPVRKENMTPREQAAANGMYGQMTRVVKEFYPIKLLCKRFGVADPHPEGEPKTVETGDQASTSFDGMPLPKNDASWESAFVHQSESAPGKENVPPSAENVVEGDRQPRTLAEVGMADDVNQGRDTLTYTKPSIDIFKAIFASDDEDDEEEDEQPTKSNGAPVASTAIAGPGTRQIYEDPYPVKQDPADLATFKPVFGVRKDKTSAEGEGEATNGVEGEGKKDKKKKDKKKRKGVLSFDVGDDEGDAPREKKKKSLSRRESPSAENGKVDDEVDGSEWVEKPSVAPRLVGRKGAADYM